MPRIYTPQVEEEQYTAFSGPKLDLLKKLFIFIKYMPSIKKYTAPIKWDGI